MQTNQQLIDDINACEAPAGKCAFWWLGQQSYVLKLRDKVLYLDPFLSENPRRNVAPLLKPEELENAFLVFGTHDHYDHINREVWPPIATASPNANFVCSELHVADLAESLGIPADRFIGMDDGRSFEMDGIRVTAVASAHEFLEADPKTGVHPHLGFVIEADGCRVYHAGDTCLYEGIHAKLRDLAPDVMMLPINGRDAERFARGCIGNMTYQEAADLAGAIGPRLTVPGHFDMFDGNTEDPELFRAYMEVKYPDLEVLIPQHGERVIA